MTTASPFRRSWAVVIGIDQYADGIPELRTAVNDARRLGEMLSTLHGYELISLLDGEATRERIGTLLTTELPKQVQADDRVLFYFAGHGVARDGDEGPNGFLLPVDAKRGTEESFLHMPFVHDALLALPCRHMLVVLDSCFSGAFRWSGSRAAMDEVEVVHQEKYDRFVRDPAWQVLTSASQDQKAIDQLTSGVLGQRDVVGNHSPFALALFDAIQGKGDLIPRGEGDGLVTATELYLYVEEVLQNAAAAVGREQKPVLWPLKKHDKGEFVFFVPGRELSLPPAPPLTFDRNPWIGLASYDAGNAALFFGRDSDIAALAAHVTARPLTVVLGASGTGKSSLVKAGVVPKLAAEGWHVLPVMRPGSTPMAALAQALSSADSVTVAATPAAITARLKALVTAHPEKPVLLVIDQFEELITLAKGPEERAATLTLLSALSNEHPDAFRLVVTIRTDFEPNFDRSAFGDAWMAGRFVIAPMSRENMRKVVEQPATARVLYFEPSNLVDRLLDEVVATPGALPLLSFALSEMYIHFVKRQSADRAITTQDYDALGGVAGALRSRAESEYAALDAAHQATLRRVMLRLVSNDGGGVARRRATDVELDFADPAERERARHVVTQLTAARLLVEGREADGESFVEPAHDALVRGWGRLLEWIRDEGEARFPLLQQQRLARAAGEWDRAPAAERDGMLWRDSARSSQLAPLVQAKAEWLTTRELAFAKRSIRGRNIARVTTAAAVLLIALGGVAATVAGLRASRRAEEVRLASIARTAQSLATEEPLMASLILASIDSTMVSHLDGAARLSLIGTAMQLNSAPQVTATFGNVMPVVGAEVSADRRWLIVRMANTDLWLTDLTTGTYRRFSADSLTEAQQMVFDQAGTRLALASVTGRVAIFNLADSTAPPLRFSGADFTIQTAAFTRSGRAIVTTDVLGVLRVVATDSSARYAQVPVTDTALTPVDSLRLRWTASDVAAAYVLADDRVAGLSATGSLRVWSAQGQLQRTVVLPKNEPITEVAVSHDGQRLALGGEDGAVWLVDIAGARVSPLPLGAHRTEISALAWSADDAQLVSGAADGTVTLWNPARRTVRRKFDRPDEPMDKLSFAANGTQFIGASPYTYHAVVFDTSGTMVTLAGHTDVILTAAFTAADRQYVTVSRDGSIWLWNPPPPPLHRATTVMEAEHASGGDITAVAFTRDSRAAALASRDGWIYRYALDSAGQGARIVSDTGTLRALRWSDDGRELQALRYTGERARWFLDSATRRRRDVANPTKDFLLETELTADGRHALAITTDGAATLWDLASDAPPLRTLVVPAGRVCRDPDDEQYVEEDENAPECFPRPRLECVAASGTGTWLATCDPRSGGGIILASRDPRYGVRRVGAAGAYAAVALSPDGALLALDNGRGKVAFLSTTSPEKPARQLTVEGSETVRLLYSPDGRRLALQSYDNWVRVVDIASGVTQLTVRPRGQKLQLLRFSPNGKYLLAAGEGEKEARLWSVDGSGYSLALPSGGGLIAEVEVSPDGRWLVTTNDRQSAQLHPLDVNLALSPFRARAICMSQTARQRYLLESPRVAREGVDACTRRHEPSPRSRRE